jgi:hypothetical protein
MSLVSKPSENRGLVIVEAVITFGDQAPPEAQGLGADKCEAITGISDAFAAQGFVVDAEPRR